MLVPLTDRSLFDLDRAFADFDAILRDFDRGFGLTRARPGLSRSADAVLRDEGEALVLSAVLPGVAPEAIDLQVTADTVTLRAERKLEAPEGHKPLHNERETWRFSRAWTLPTRVDPSAVTAEAKHGLLTVRLPKAADTQPRRVAIA